MKGWERSMKNNKIYEFIKDNGIAVIILTFIIHLLIYIFMISKLEYFNIDRSFYEFNLFSDFSINFITSIILSIPGLFSIYFGYLSYKFVEILINNINTIKEITKEKFLKFIKTKLFKYLIALLLLYIAPYGLIFLLTNYYKLSFWDIIKLYNYFVLFAIITGASVYGIKRMLFDKWDIFSKTYFVIIIVAIIALSIKITIDYGKSVAENIKGFYIIDQGNNYIVLYNTNEYAIVANYMHNKDKNEICILNNKIKKIDLNNKELSYWTFKKINLESKGEC